jgi:UDP-N-acetylmuramate: L-alanyl-gamma-D-glutamyl-meso-diaminopimelate ligase
MKGEAAGVLVVDDFAHHPTAIRETINAARGQWMSGPQPRKKLWAVIEPRSNTMRRRVFESVLPDALAGADAVLFGPVHRAQLLSDEQRLSPERVAEVLKQRGKPAVACATVEEIVERLAGQAGGGDLVLVMSNGSFDGMCERLLERLQQREGKS